MEQTKTSPEDEAEKREVAEFERFCFKKRFPSIPNTVIYPVVEESIRTKVEIPVDDEMFRTLQRTGGEVKLPKMYLVHE